MGVASAVRKPLYTWLRQGKWGGGGLYSLAGFVYWLVTARTLYAGTRIAEIPWVIRKLGEVEPGCKLLQVGDVILKEALRNYKLTLIDYDAEEREAPGLKVYKDDIRAVSLPAGYFDVALSVSTLEHIGVLKVEFTDGDKTAVAKIRDALRPGGLLVFTVPFGQPAIKDTFRVYDRDRLLFMLDKGWSIEEETYLMWSGWSWKPVSPEVAEKASFLKNNTGMNQAVALITARKEQAQNRAT